MKPSLDFTEELFYAGQNQRLLLLLSGGKDSVCCLYLLSRLGNLHLEALCFIHKWSSPIALEEAERHCDINGIPLHTIDYTERLHGKLGTFYNGRPCLICKPEMYKLALKYAGDNGFTWIVTGDNGNDITTQNRLSRFNQSHCENRIYCSRYLAGELGVELPENMNVLRPLIQSSSIEIEEYLDGRKIKVRHIGSTGDKYFDYSREGCPLQFCDPGTYLDAETCDALFKYNEISNAWGRHHNVKTSVHIPSTFVVTIPTGHEAQLMSYLESKGLPVDRDANSCDMKMQYYSVAVENYPDKRLKPEVFEYAVRRFVERFDSTMQITRHSDTMLSAQNAIQHFSAFMLGHSLMLNFSFRKQTEMEMLKARIHNLCIEIFHTRSICFLQNDSSVSHERHT